MIETAITILLAGGSAADFQSATSSYSPAEINRVATLLLAAGTISIDQFRAVLVALVA
jgi:hypothetical protein